jgi:hypothetical protein
VLVIRPNETAELWVDTAAVALTILAKRDISAGSAVFERDIVDITERRFPLVNIGAKDRVICLFRQGWRFALFFELNPEGNLHLDDAAKTLGRLYRELRYRYIYDMLANKAAFDRLIEAGWFPFVEIIGSEFEVLADACQAGFDLDEAEAKLLERFNEKRLEGSFRRWMAKPHFAPKEVY